MERLKKNACLSRASVWQSKQACKCGDQIPRAMSEWKRLQHFFAKFQRLAMELDWNKATLISNFMFKLSYKMQRQLSTGNKKPTNLFRYAKRCQRVLQRLKNPAHIKAVSKKYAEKNATAATATTSISPAPKKVSTSTTTIQTTNSTNLSCRQPTTHEQDRLIREKSCFTCKEHEHQTAKCSNEWKPMTLLAASCMVVHKVQKLQLGNAEPLLEVVSRGEKNH